MAADNVVDMLVQLGALELLRAMLLDALVLLRMVLQIPVTVFTAVRSAARWCNCAWYRCALCGWPQSW